MKRARGMYSSLQFLRLSIFHAVRDRGIFGESSSSDVVGLPCHPYPAAVWRLGGSVANDHR